MYDGKYPDICIACGAKLSYGYNPDMKLKRKLDYAATYDSYYVVSQRFKDFCAVHFIQTLPLLPLTKYPDYYYFDVYSLPILQVNRDSIDSDGQKKCKICNFLPAYGTVQIEPDFKFEHPFYRSDVMLSDPGQEQPDVLISKETYDILKIEKFKGIDIVPLKYRIRPEGVDPNRIITDHSHLEIKEGKSGSKKKKKTYSSVEVQYGDAEPELTIEGLLAYPIWTWALDQEEDLDETWVIPIINTDDVTDDMIDVFILLQNVETGQYAYASYNPDVHSINTVYLHDDDDFFEIDTLDDVQYPFVLRSIPKISGNEDVRFEIRSGVVNFRAII
jgi:hypothetical protein